MGWWWQLLSFMKKKGIVPNAPYRPPRTPCSVSLSLSLTSLSAPPPVSVQGDAALTPLIGAFVAAQLGGILAPPAGLPDAPPPPPMPSAGPVPSAPPATQAEYTGKYVSGAPPPPPPMPHGQ
jgi:hypothetical protein